MAPRYLLGCRLLILLVAKLERLRSSCRTLEFVNTSENKDESHLLHDHLPNPDLVAYVPGCSRRGTMDFSRIEVSIVVKVSESHDPFRDLPPLDDHPTTDTDRRFEADTSEGMQTLGQMTTCVAAQMAQQLRPWAYSVVLCGGHARFVRWDRSGAIFTPCFNYEMSGHLERFFTSYSSLDDRSHGIDTSTTILEDEDQRVKVAKEGFGFGSRQGPQPRFYEFQLGPDQTVVGYSPMTSTPSLFGRASQPFIVWDSAVQENGFSRTLGELTYLRWWWKVGFTSFWSPSRSPMLPLLSGMVTLMSGRL